MEGGAFWQGCVPLSGPAEANLQALLLAPRPPVCFKGAGQQASHQVHDKDHFQEDGSFHQEVALAGDHWNHHQLPEERAKSRYVPWVPLQHGPW